MKTFARITLLLMFCVSEVAAQQHLSLQEAIARTLQYNYDIAISGISVQQAERNNTYGNAGFLPDVSIGASATQTRLNVKNDLANGSQQINPNAVNTNINPAINVSWTIYDGGKMFLAKKQLNELEALSRIQLKEQMQALVSGTIRMYARVVLQQRQIIAIDTALYLARTRMDLALLKFTTGAGAKVDYLQARVDYNARQSDSLTYSGTFAQACDSLSMLMGSNENVLYQVDENIQLNTSLKPVDPDRLRDLNLSLTAFRKNVDLAHLNEDIAKTAFLPTVRINGGYTYNRSASATGFALFSQNYGTNGTVSLSMPVFKGGNLRRQSKVASLQTMKDELLYEKQNTIIGRQYRTTWRNYNLSVAAYKLAKENIEFARENLDVQLARFRVGVGTTLESREAENAFVLAIIRLYMAEYNVKVNETLVLELENKLISES